MKPLLKWKGRILEYCSNFYRERFTAFRAFEKFSALNPIYLFRVSAIDTNRLSIPSGHNKKLSARFFSRETLNKLQEVIDFGLFNFLFHNYSLVGDFEL
jgi:hypothetical protein